MSETKLSRSIQVALESIGCIVVRVQAGTARGVHGGHMELAMPGTPDLWVAAQGFQGWLEVKFAGGVLNSHQEAWHKVARSRGVRVETVRSVEQALRVVTGRVA